MPDTTRDASSPDPTTSDPELHKGTRVDDDTVLGPDDEATPDPSVDISVEEVADLPKGKMLEVDDVTLRFGGVTALDGVSFHINTGEILGLIGPNGEIGRAHV